MTNLISFSDNSEQVQDESAQIFYAEISRFIDETLLPSRDAILISKPVVQSRSANSHMLLLTINNKRSLALKRCYDSPEFLRRELVVMEARRRFGFPDYTVALKHGLILLNEKGTGTCAMLRGWEARDILIIDFGFIGDTVNLRLLPTNEIEDMPSFMYQMGMWAAFNYLLVVRDRHPGNFVYVKSRKSVLSVDNEEGPFDSQGRTMTPQDIVLQMKGFISPILIAVNDGEMVLAFKSGFEHGWSVVGNLVGGCNGLRMNEKQLVFQLLSQDWQAVCDEFIS